MLEEIGGFRTETVTEDIHTSMHIHARSYKSIFYNRNLACGLTPETYHDYLRQRMRWAKGLTQFFLYDNPFLKKGLTFPQRIIYFASFYYFLHGFPRLIYLIAPLSYLLAGIPPLKAFVPDLINFYFSFYIANLLVFKALAGKYRHPFWSDVYETVMHFHLCIAVVEGILGLKKSLYRVTPKGLTLRAPLYDIRNSFFQLFLFLLLIIATVYGSWRFDIFTTHESGAAVSLFWALYNIFILSAAILVAREKPQMRQYHRVLRKMPCEIILSESESFITETRDLSESGMLFVMDSYRKLNEKISVRLISEWGELTEIDGQIIRYEKGKDGLYYVGVKFLIENDEQYHSLIRQIFCPPDVWEKEEEEVKKEKKILSSLLILLSAPIRAMKERISQKRLEPRIPLELNCEVHFKGLKKKGRILNLSYHGALIWLKGNIPSDVHSILIEIPWEKKSIRVQAIPRWVKRTFLSTYIGLRFVDTNNLSRNGLERILSSNKRES